MNQQNTTENLASEKNKENARKISTLESGVYSYEQAIDLAGTGWYNRGLLATLSISLLAMGIDMFGFSVIVTGSTCDFELEHGQKSILMSMPFIGAIAMAYAWGYLSDTRGRRMCLLYGMWGGFITSFLTAFSPNWIVLAVLKIFSTSLCSSAQSCTVTLLGESCAEKVRDFYLLIMSSVLMLYLISYVVPGYFILNLTFSINIGFINFTPWRLLAIVLSLPLGLSALGLHFFYESPKFLVNIGKEVQALDHLQQIWYRNGGGSNTYPVQKVYLKEEQKINRKDVSILQSLRDQTIPLFKPPLLWNSLQMFYLITIIYSINNSLVMWMPLIVDTFSAGLHDSVLQDSRSLCSIISGMESQNSTINHSCISYIEVSTLLSGVSHGIIFAGVTLCVSKLASKKKWLLITFLLIPMLSSLGAVFNENNVVSLVLYVGMLMTNLCMGILFTYYVDMFPTSHRGMGCLGVMVARISGVAGVNFLGSMIVANCSMTFYAFGAYLLSGILVSCFLP